MNENTASRESRDRLLDAELDQLRALHPNRRFAAVSFEADRADGTSLLVGHFVFEGTAKRGVRFVARIRASEFEDNLQALRSSYALPKAVQGDRDAASSGFPYGFEVRRAAQLAA